jgi:hypothetical protein
MGMRAARHQPARRAAHATQPVLDAMAPMERVMVQREQPPLARGGRALEVALEQPLAIFATMKRQARQIA